MKYERLYTADEVDGMIARAKAASPPCPTCEALARTVMLDQTSHDTTPPQRQWVGLTDDEVYKIAFALEGEHWRKIADAIEAKLREKNT